jgi:glycosyltransferase involved in cell wall biosynthesis
LITPSVALVHDHLVQRGGGDRVLVSMARAFPSATVHTAFYRPENTYAELADFDIRPLPIGRIPRFNRHHRAALPLLAPSFGRLRLDADVVVCGSSGWAAGVRASGRKIVYFHALARWLHEREAYLAGWGRFPRLGLAAVAPWLRRWDDRAVRSAHRLFVYSPAMADQVRRVYGLEAEVLPPPVSVDPQGPAQPVDLEPGFALCVCRLIAYKNIDLVIEAFRRRPGDRLVVVGSGPEEGRLRASAPPNVTLLGQADERTMRWLYANCRVMVSAAYEPFGLVTLEANAFGRPVAVFGQGGFRDTVVEGVTGRFFTELDPALISRAVDEVDVDAVDAATLQAHARRWSEEAFIANLRAIVAEEAARS